MSLTPAFLDELRARTSLTALVGKTVKLTRAGRESKGCCPFHNEKTPSFYVNDDKGFYHCFGCSAHGDAIRWLTDHQGLPFMDAVKELAAAAGMELPAQDARAAQAAERARSLHDVMQAAADWFAAQLGGIEGAAARALLEKRGVTEATRRAFAFGYAPDSRGRLRAALKEYGDAMLVEAGLLIQVEGKEPYDRFRGRLMIPIRDPRGRVIAFGGRIIEDGEPKYLNSPDTPLFDKGRTLYNLDRAAPAARKTARLFVVEGYMDAIALAQGGIGEVVAPLGTALTEQQLERLWRVVDVPVLCLDGDAAGQKAALRAAHRALPMLAPGRSLAFATLPEGQDPDDLMRAKGARAFETLVQAAEPLVDRLWKHELAAEPLDTPEQRAGLKKRLSDLAETIADPSVKSEYKAEFRHRFDERFARNRQPFQQRTPFYPIAARKPGQKWTPPAPPVTEDAKKVRAAGGIDRVLAKAVLAGLIRHPAEIARHMEVLGGLKLADGALGRLFEAVVDVALEDRRDHSANGGALDSGRLVTILARSGFETVAHDLLRADTMPYSFTRAGADEKQACDDLDEAIAVLVARPEVDAALAEATSAMQARFTVEAFERQVALVNEQRALDERLANLVQANEDARALGPEDD
ncbi:MAG: DNA primase [Sphingomonas taxi]|uniref:DNA primase n=1 Tax=Sphingomonas taxi TaxID=1549858 RepID=A0A2W5P7Q7_9SPHN|nr:MAG: DNA primase [Sphingomonas taxi]